ncbi:MAG: hypothetical protein ACRD0U_15610 [Acidimicrobiales bacterium]
MTDGPSDALLLKTFGPRLLAYLCNVDEQQVDVRFRESTLLPEQSEAALRQLIPLAERVATERLDRPGIPLSLSRDLLGLVPDGADTSIGNIVRLSAGGDIGTPEPGLAVAGDEVKALLFRLARDAYPQLLVPVDEPWHHLHLSFFRHPSRAELQRAVDEDEQFSRMYPSEDGDLGRGGVVFNSLGRGGTIQSVMFGETLINAAWDLAIMSTSSPTLAELYEAISASVDVLRCAISGQPAETRALLAFTGITTSGRSIETPWGDLRPITDDERTSAPSMLDGAVSGTDSEGRSVTVSYAGEVVLDTALPFALTVHEWRTGDEFPDCPSFEQLGGSQALRRRSEGLQLAVLLAVERPAGQWATARFTWHWIADPTAHGRSMGWADPRSSPGFMPTELSEEECQALRDWCELIEANWSSTVDIAVRRVLSAAQGRTDPSDRLVDSVIAWENLFGTSEGEPRLRISSAMAWLLADTAAGRADLQREIKQLYDDRSKIVHGGSFNETAIAEKANRALDLALSSLRALIGSRTDVLSSPDGSARSLKLILDS